MIPGKQHMNKMRTSTKNRNHKQGPNRYSMAETPISELNNSIERFNSRLSQEE